MIKSDFLIMTEAGLYCAAGDFYLDPKVAVRNAVISHAHADHAAKGCLKVWATRPTLDFMLLRYKKRAGRDLQAYAFGMPFFIGEVEICFYPAGHMLGSAQVLMTYQGLRYVYTGDFKLQADPTCEPLEFITADVLITETTFANPAVMHPHPETEIRRVGDVRGKNVMIGAYSLGKAQRIVSLLNQYCLDKEIRVHYSITPFNHVYEQAGRSLGNWKLFDRKEFLKAGNLVCIVPPLTFHSYYSMPGVSRFFASGWENLQSDNCLFISDHADWNDLLTMIGKVKPSEVWTLHGDGRHLKKYFENQLTIRLLNEPAA